MKKVIALSVCLLFGLASLTGCTANEAPFEEKTHTADPGEITGVQIDVKDRKIEVEPSADGKIHLTYSESSKDFYEIDTEGGTLVMTSASDRDWADYIGEKASQKDRTIRLQIPVSGLASLRLTTSNEDLALPAAHFSDHVSLRVNNGNIDVEGLDVGNAATLEAKNGSITGTIIGSYDLFSIQSTVKKGRSNLPERKEDGEKSLEVAVNNGNIDVDFLKDTTH